MSDKAEPYVLKAMSARAMPDPCQRRKVLMALAEKHFDGPFRVSTAGLARALDLHPVTLWRALVTLQRAGLVQASNIGGDMTVVFPFDFPPDHPAYVRVSPAEQEVST